MFLLIFRYTGLEFIYRKFIPSNSNNPKTLPTGFIWLTGIYVAFFSVASERYENRIDMIENRVNAIYSQLTTHVFSKALSRIPKVQNMGCPEKPEILQPKTVFRSLFIDTECKEIVPLMKDTVEDWKTKLEGTNLSNVNLEEANLNGANLKGTELTTANLIKVNLINADLSGANLKNAVILEANLVGAKLMEADLEMAQIRKAIITGANLTGAKLQGANLQETDLISANLHRADLKGANLKGANLLGASLQEANLQGADLIGCRGLKAEDLCAARGIYQAKLDPDIKKELNRICHKKN